MQAMLMTDPADKLDPMSLLFYMSSFSVLLLLPTTLILEPGVFGEVSWTGCACLREGTCVWHANCLACGDNSF